MADTLSDIEVPSLAEGEGQRERYLATLDRLQAVVNRVAWIIPGHGSVADRAEAQRRLDADRRYLEGLPGLVATSSPDASDHDLAGSAADALGETRTAPGPGWDMHVANVRLLRAAG